MFDGNKITHTPKRVCVILFRIKGDVMERIEQASGAHPRVALASRGEFRALRGVKREKQKSNEPDDSLLFCSVVAGYILFICFRG